MWLEKVLEKTSFTITLIIGGMLAPLITSLFGDGALTFTLVNLFILFSAADWISGISASKKDEVYGSQYGIDGVFRTFFLLLVMAGANQMDLLFRSPGVLFGMITFGILYHIIQSATANAIRTGWGTHIPEETLIWLAERVKSEIIHKEKRAKERRKQDRSD